MGDIDLLVRARSRRSERGSWRRERLDAAQATSPEERSYDDHQHLSPLEDADGLQIGLELHTSLFTHQAPFRSPPRSCGTARGVITIAGAPALVPSPEDQLLHAALHFAWSHEMTFGAWRTLRDVERIVATNALDWTRRRGASDERLVAPPAATGRFDSRATSAGVTVPDAVLAALSPRLPEPVLRRLTRYFAEQALPDAGGRRSAPCRSRARSGRSAIRPRSQGHGASRPWLDTEEWVRGPDGMRNVARRSGARRFLAHSFGLLRSVVSLPDRIMSDHCAIRARDRLPAPSGRWRRQMVWQTSPQQSTVQR